VRKLITGIEKEVARRLEDNRERLDRLATRLLEEETLQAQEFESLLAIGERSNGNDAKPNDQDA